MKDKLIIGGLIFALVLGGFGLLNGDTETIVRETVKELGAFPGPDIMSDYLIFNGLEKRYFSSGLNQASTTVCSFLTPAATTTLMYASLTLTTGSTTDMFFEIGKGAEMDATTTSLGAAQLTGQSLTLVASSTQGLAGDKDIFGPSEYLNFKYGNATDDGITNVLVGTCLAEFIVVGK